MLQELSPYVQQFVNLPNSGDNIDLKTVEVNADFLFYPQFFLLFCFFVSKGENILVSYQSLIYCITNLSYDFISSFSFLFLFFLKRLFIIPPNSRNRLQFVKAHLDAAKSAGVKFILLLSVTGTSSPGAPRMAQEFK